MEETGDVRVIVHDQTTGIAIDEAKVTINPENNKSSTQESDQHGQTRFNDLPGGMDIAIHAVAGDYEPLRLPMLGVCTGAVITRYVGLKRRPIRSERDDGVGSASGNLCPGDEGVDDGGPDEKPDDS